MGLFSYKIYILQYPSNGTWLKYELLQGNTYGLISSIFPFSSVYLEVILNGFYTLLGSVYLRVIFNSLLLCLAELKEIKLVQHNKV